MSDYDAIRPGEIALPFDPGERAGDAHLVFIGRVHSPWKTREACPKNIRQAREQGKPATVIVDKAWRSGLIGLEKNMAVILVYWMDRARRDLIVLNPKHSDNPKGVFALRAPVRPNNISLGVVTILDIDIDHGKIEIDAIDCLDGTPLLDIKPWIATVDQLE